ncbi:MAG TPA: efflux RND transporter permease subunit [Bacteroidales bacterium]|nr:efflux RND transporter permease subunit [Bacteroidales bacterium]
MLDKIIALSLKNRLIVLSVSLLILMTGIYFVSNMEVDIFPELTAPTVVIMTEAPGMATEEVEQLVSFQIETTVNGATGIRRVRSSSTMGFSIVWVEFDWGTDIYKARQTVAERLFQVRELLPEGVDQPVIAPQTSLLGEIMILALESDSMSLTDLRTMADWNVAPRLLSIPGVAQVHTIGGDSKEYQILADPLKMNYAGVSLAELISTCENMNINTSGGFINEYGNKYIIRGMARTNNLNDIAGSLIKTSNGKPVRIGDVAVVKTGTSLPIGTASYRGKDAVLVTVTRQPDANSVRLTEKINEAIAEIRKNSDLSVRFHTDIYNQADFIKTSVNNVLKALLEGGFFVVLILFFFLLNPRTTFISLMAIPLSLVVTLITLKLLGYTINTMSLGGMAIAIGSLVDDAIIDVENSFKQLRKNVLRPAGERLKVTDVVFRASSEMRSSILNATIIIIIAFIPLFLLEDLEGRMLKPLGITFIVSLFASLIVAITITPVLCTYLLSDETKLAKSARGTWAERKLGSLYRKILNRTLEKNRIVFGITTAMLAAAFIMALSTGSAFLPSFNEGALTINLSTMPGISLDESAKIGRQAEKILLEFPEVKSVGRKTGRAELAEHSFGENVSELDVPFALLKRSRDEFMAEVRNKLGSLPGTNVEVGQPVTHRIDNMLSGTKANIAIKIFGDDLNELYTYANEIKRNISGIEGIGDLNVEQLVETPQLKIKPRREMLARYGITQAGFNTFIEYAINGRKVSDVLEDEKRFPLILRYNDESRSTLEQIRSSMIDAGDGKKIALSAVADFESSSGPYSVNRENVRRKIVVSVNTTGNDAGTVLREIRNRIDDTIDLPENYNIEYGGQFESAQSATRRLLIASLAAILLIFIVLYQEFRNSTLAWIVLLNLPLAIIGGIFAILLTSNVISIPAIIGFITLFGIATRNGILLISRFISKENELDIKKSIIEGSVDRLNPILMTALTAALALIPMALAGDKPGNEIQSPMAMVILGGLLSSTLLNLIVVPSVFYVYAGNRKPTKNNDVKE